MTLCFATKNPNKLREIQQIVGPEIEIITPTERGLEEDIPETGETIRENAELKAKYVFEKLRIPCFADDTGLEVDALGGAPGVYSARYAGNSCNSTENINLLLKNLKGKSPRTAQFVTGICFIHVGGNEKYFEGVIKGQITSQPRGNGGFGYDPVFVPDGYGLTFAEMTMEKKNNISHRSLAFQQLVKFLSTAL